MKCGALYGATGNVSEEPNVSGSVEYVKRFKMFGRRNYTWQREEKEKDRGRDSQLVPSQWILQPAIKSERCEAAKRINAY